MERHWFSSDAVCRRLERLLRIWKADGTRDKSVLGGVVSRRVTAGLIRGVVDTLQVLDSVSYATRVSTQVRGRLGRRWSRRFCGTLRTCSATLPWIQVVECLRRRWRRCRPEERCLASGADGAGRGCAGRGRLQGRGVGKIASGGGVIPPPAR